MYENHNFLRETVVEVNAAVVGISQHRWIGIGEESTEDDAKLVMQEKHFDILPIYSGSNITSYFGTVERNNFSNIKKAEITHRDVMPLQTHIRDVIKNFYTEKRYFFFLLDENKVSGLISESNLNSRQVKVWLFGLLSELEVRLGMLVKENFQNEDKLQQKVFDKTDGNYRDIKRRFSKDCERGVESNFVEYLYLSTLIDLIEEEKIYLKLGYKDKDKFKNDYRNINNLRNTVMHSKSLITKEKSVKELWILLDKIEESLFLLR